MTSLGSFLCCEAFTPDKLVRQAVRAESAGFERLWISDHFHPWNDKQGQSPFVWSVIGALSQACSLPVTTAVTCPIVRIHPSVIAQAAATPGRRSTSTSPASTGHPRAPGWRCWRSRWR